MTVGFWASRVARVARWAAASAPAATARNSTSEYAAACALALLVMAAIQPWSAAGAEKPMTTFCPGAAFGLASPPPVLIWELLPGSLLVQPASTAPAPRAAPLRRSRRRSRTDMGGLQRVYRARRPSAFVTAAIDEGRDQPGRTREKRFVRERYRNCWISTAATMMPPLTMFWTSVDRLLMAKRLVMVEKTSTPKRAPMMVPRPPLSSVPPMIAAAIASSSYRFAIAAWALVACEVSMMAPMPQHS